MHRVHVLGKLLALVVVAAMGGMLIAGEAPLQTPEETRDALQQLMKDYSRLAPGNDSVATRAERLNANLDSMNYAQLEALHAAMSSSPMLQRGMNEMRNAANAVEFGETGDELVATQVVDPVYSLECGDVRVGAAMAKMQLDMFEALQFATAAAQLACEEDLLDCPAAQMANEAAITAGFVYENTLFCWADINGAETTALGGTLAELETAVGAISADFQAAIDTQTMTLEAALDAQTGDLTDALATVEANLTTLLEEVLANQATMLGNQGVILVNQDDLLAGQAEIKQLLITPPGRRAGWNNRPVGGNDGNHGNGNGNGQSN